jgi:glycosyltransferase involved in cell wall biosynthesis
MPTADRRRFVPNAIEDFLAQTYPNRELVIVDDGRDPVGDLVPDLPSIRYVRLDSRLTTGPKRNASCAEAHGEIIVHWDDDDWSSPDRVEVQVGVLLDSGADVCGLRDLIFYEPAAERAWRYRYPPHARPWVAGGTMCYRRSLWESSPFPDVRHGEDTQFVWARRSLRVHAVDRGDLYVAIIHPGNTSVKRTSGRRWSAVPRDELLSILGSAASRYLARPTGSVSRSSHHKEHPLMPARTSPSRTATDHVTVSIPHVGPGDYLRRAVESVLAQTHRALTCVVVFDGDEQGFDAIADIADPRLVRYMLSENRGRYFADQVVLDATVSPYFVVQDSDDWSEPTRIERLLGELLATDADVCMSDVLRHDERSGTPNVTRQRWPHLSRPVGPKLFHRAGHQALYRTEMLRSIGGWYAGYRIGFDTCIMNLVELAGGRVACVSEPLYHRTIRSGSLTTAATTGFNSPVRQRVLHELRQLHGRAYSATRGLPADGAAATIRRLVIEGRSPEATVALERDAAILAVDLSRRVPAGRGIAAPRGLSLPMVVRARVPDVHEVLAQHVPLERDWSISGSGAIELYQRLLSRRPARILDVGSGLSTVVEAAAAARYGATVTGLEHDPRHAQRTREMLAAVGLVGVVDLVVAPLVATSHACGTGPWYAGQPEGKFDFIVVDGPPRDLGGRIATFPELIPHRRRGWEFWLFDAGRPEEQACLAAWSRHYRFDASVEGIDPTGVAVLRSRSHRSGKGPVVDRLGISILTGGRPGLLERTLSSFARKWPAQAEAAYTFAFVNGPDEQSRAVIEDAGWVDRIVTYEQGVLRTGMATSFVVGAVAGRGAVDVVLHLEDDWETRTVDDEALVRAAAILDDESVGQVRLRHCSEAVLGRHMLTHEEIVWRPRDGYRTGNAHFTFNPSLMRSGLADRVFPADDQRDAQRRFLATGREVVQVEPGVFAHLGEKHSRRRSLGRRP